MNDAELRRLAELGRLSLEAKARQRADEVAEQILIHFPDLPWLDAIAIVMGRSYRARLVELGVALPD